jgi:hypothetical protein
MSEVLGHLAVLNPLGSLDEPNRDRTDLGGWNATLRPSDTSTVTGVVVGGIVVA